MAVQRVVHTTLAGDAVAEFVSSAFDVPARPSARLVNRAFNDIYEIETKPSFFLRVGRQARRSLADAELEGRTLAEARAAGVPVAPAVRGRDGRFAQALAAQEGERAVLLFARAPGVDARDTTHHAGAQGRALARLHGVTLSPETASGLRRLDARTLVEEPAGRAVAQLSGRPALAGRLRDIADGTRAYLEQAQASFGVGLCHGDYHGYNATIEGDTATLIDFDEFGIGWQAYDLATFLWTCHIVSPDACALLWSHFLAGYQSLRRLPAADVDALEAMLIARELWTFGAWADGAERWGSRWFHSFDAEERIERLGARFERLIAPRLA